MAVTLLVLVIVAAAAVWIYNRLVSERNQVLAAWSDIDVQLVRRHDLVPQLVATVKAYASYEQATQLAVTELRARSEAARHLPDKAAVETELESAVHRLIAVAEAYPELKADASFLQLQRDLVAIEDHIQYARRFYNGAVRQFNNRQQTFPHLLIARPFGFERAEYFEVETPEQRGVVRVDLQP
jgi:LemA protein